MIVGLFHPGSGVGDQLFCYLATRITAERLGVPFSMVGEFKGNQFISLNGWESHEIPHHIEMPSGKLVIDNDFPVYEGRSYYDPEFNFIKDNTIVDGCRIQDEKYYEAEMPQIDEWLKTEPLDILATTCVINFRGREFTKIPELFLPKSYWYEAIERMKAKGFTDFEVHTDDPETATQFFPHFHVKHDVGLNWRSIRYATGAIIANSAFPIIPRLLAHYDDMCVTIAPRGWARYHNREWSTSQSYYRYFTYI